MLRRLFFLILMLSNVPAFADPKLNLADLKSWTITVAEDAIPSERYAAEEFQSLLQQAAGFELPIGVNSNSSASTIYIGYGPAMAASPAGFPVDDLGEEGLRIRILPDAIAIAGGRPRGTLYGVYEFMERYLDVRFLTHDHTYVPSQPHKKIPCEEWKYTPSFTFRWSYYKENADFPEFAARLRVNTTTNDEKLGGVTQQGLISHSLFHLLPVEQYGKEHPEYYALVDGQRKLEMGGGGPELCVTNPDVIDIVAQNVIKDLDQHPDAQNYSVSQNDNDAYCHCENCEAINQREGTPMGSHLAFVNAVAERVEKKYPNVKIGTLAYWYTRKPPKTIRPRANVQIQLCSIECSTLYPLDDPSCTKNTAFCQDMDEWGKMCDDIWIWNYNTNFRYYDLPFPNLRVISANIQYFLKNHVKGVFMQANGNSNCGELCDLRNYVMARCLWNPSLDSWELAKEFCRLHYGKAANTMIHYLTYLHDNAEKLGFAPTCFPMPFEVGLNPQSAGKIWDYFQKALDEAEDDEVRNRVEKASICAYRTVLETCTNLNVENGVLRVDYPEQYGDVVGKYKELTQKYGETRAEEWQPIDDYYKILQKTTQDGYQADVLENKTWRLVVLPEDNGKIVEWLHKPSGQHLLMPPDYRSLRHLFESMTLQEQGLQGYDHNKPAAFEMKHEGDSLILTKTLEDGSILQRTIGIGETDPDSTVNFSTQITHKGNEAKEYQFKIFPEFNMGSVTHDGDLVRAYIQDNGWVHFNQDWKESSGPNLSLLENAQGGGFAFFNSKKKFGILESYSADQFEKPHFWWSDTYPLLHFDLTTKTVKLNPGESYQFQYAVQFIRHAPK